MVVEPQDEGRYDGPANGGATIEEANSPATFGFGNHSETAFVAPGQLADSPTPTRNRKHTKLRKPTARPVTMAASEYQLTVIIRPTRVPSQSRNLPEAVSPNA